MFLPRIGSSAITSFTVDTDVQTYLNLVKSTGGTYDGNTLKAYNTFVTNLKADGLWDLCDEIGVFAGINITTSVNPILIKLKSWSVTSGGTVSASNTGNKWLPVHYNSTGAYTGLSGTGAQYATLNYNPTLIGNITPYYGHMFVYVDGQERDTTRSCRFIGSQDTSGTGRASYMGFVATSGRDYGAWANNVTTPNQPSTFYGEYNGGTLMISLSGDRYQRFYVNGVMKEAPAYQGAGTYAFYNASYTLFYSTNVGNQSTRIIRGYSYGKDIPPASAARLTLRWQQFMNMFGASATNLPPF
jgi:hypothetical protein